jgi:hypothetical protein
MGFSPFVYGIGWRVDQTKGWRTVELRLATDVAGPDFVSTSGKTHSLDGMVLPVEARHVFPNSATFAGFPADLQATVPGTVALEVAPSLAGGGGHGFQHIQGLKLLAPFRKLAY